MALSGRYEKKMPAILNFFGNVVLGGTMAFIARRSIAARRELLSWPLLFVLAFEAVIVTPIATYLFRFYPQWSMLYGFDPQVFTGLDRFVGLLSLVAIVLNFLGVVGGYMMVRLGLITDTAWMWGGPFALSGLVALYVILFYADRIIYVGDYDSFSNGGARFFLATTPGWMGILLFVSAGAFLWWVRMRYGRRDPSFLF
jgi:hypothetical protein